MDDSKVPAYTNAEGKTIAQLEAELQVVYNEHYAPTCRHVRGYSGPDFAEMVVMMSCDPFYNMHLVAARYLKQIVYARTNC